LIYTRYNSYNFCRKFKALQNFGLLTNDLVKDAMIPKYIKSILMFRPDVTPKMA
ncbi:24699_t:CDS:1, partial [Gigaspora rosea]